MSLLHPSEPACIRGRRSYAARVNTRSNGEVMEDGFGSRHISRSPTSDFAEGEQQLRAQGADQDETGRTRSRVERGVLLLGILLIAINLRPALATVGPLVGEIRVDTGLSHTALGLLTALPLLAFGAVSALSSIVTRLLGFGGALGAALLLLIVGAGVRAVSSVELLYLGTLTLGVGIALGNVLLPALVKRDFSHRSGLLTGLYSSVLGLGSCVGAAVAVPLSRYVGWQNALAIWAVPAFVALLVWLPQVSRTERRENAGSAPAAPLRSMLVSGLAWELAFFMGLQSLTFYVMIAWLPDLLQSRGMSAAEAGWMLAIAQLPGVVGSAVVPMFAGRVRDQRHIVMVLVFLEAVALIGILLDPGFGLTLVFVSTLGLVLGGTLGLALLFLVLRSPDAAATTRLSGMVQSIGYLVAAVGPVVFGWLYELTATWTVPLLFLIVVLAGKLATGMGAARPGRVVGR